MVQRDDGTRTASAEQVHALIEQAWISIFKMHELGTQPATCERTVDELNGE